MERQPRKRVRLSQELPSEEFSQPFFRKRDPETLSHISSHAEFQLIVPEHFPQYHSMHTVEAKFHAEVFQKHGKAWVRLTKVEPGSRLENRLGTQMDWEPTPKLKQRDDAKVLEAIKKLLGMANAIAQHQEQEHRSL
jgi:hypothetical protein